MKRQARTPLDGMPLYTAMPPRRSVVAPPSDSESSECDLEDEALVWQDDIDWANYAPTRGLNPSLCVRTRILISLFAARLVTLEQRRACWTAVGDFPVDEQRVLDAMGAEEDAPRQSSRLVMKSAVETCRDLAFSSDVSDGTLLRKLKKVASTALGTQQIQAIGLCAKVNKPKKKQNTAGPKATKTGESI